MQIKKNGNDIRSKIKDFIESRDDKINIIPINENQGVIVHRHVFVFPIYYLDFPQNVELLKKSLDEMFRTGKFVAPIDFDRPSSPQENNESKQYESKTNIEKEIG